MTATNVAKPKYDKFCKSLTASKDFDKFHKLKQFQSIKDRHVDWFINQICGKFGVLRKLAVFKIHRPHDASAIG